MQRAFDFAQRVLLVLTASPCSRMMAGRTENRDESTARAIVLEMPRKMLLTEAEAQPETNELPGSLVGR